MTVDMEYDTENIEVYPLENGWCGACYPSYACCELIVADSQWPHILTKTDRTPLWCAMWVSSSAVAARHRKHLSSSRTAIPRRCSPAWKSFAGKKIGKNLFWERCSSARAGRKKTKRVLHDKQTNKKTPRKTQVHGQKPYVKTLPLGREGGGFKSSLLGDFQTKNLEEEEPPLKNNLQNCLIWWKEAFFQSFLSCLFRENIVTTWSHVIDEVVRPRARQYCHRDSDTLQLASSFDTLS